MTKRVNTTMVGSFIVGGVLLLAAMIIFFGASELFKVKDTFVMYFDSSISGLQVGSEVTFRGVKIGKVSKILVRFYSHKAKAKIPVYIEFEPGRVKFIGKKMYDDPDEQMKFLIHHGLRAQLKTKSMITGQQEIELDFHKDTPMKLVGGDPYPEIPTIPSVESELFKAIASARQTLDSINELVTSDDVKESLEHLNKTLQEGEKLVKNVNIQIEPLSNSARDSFHEVSLTARSIQTLSDYLARHPESLIQGKGRAGEHHR